MSHFEPGGYQCVMAFIRRTVSCNSVPLIQFYIRVQYSQYTHIYTGSFTTITEASCCVCVERISKRCAISFNKFASSFKSELCTILYDLYCLFAYTFFKANSSSALKSLLTGTARNTALQTNISFKLQSSNNRL